MGGQLSALTPNASTIAIEAYLSELGDVQYEKNIGNARFLKTLKGLHPDGMVVIKVFVKPTPNMDLRRPQKELKKIKRALADVGNVLTYSRIIETERAGYLVRQHLKSNLYDRISTRPFLENIEKLWITFQLLKGLGECHAREVSHGDIKSENVLVTSWNWVYMTDFASPYKPVYMPEDDPSQFSFYYDTSQRRCCYVAPERFLAAGETPEGDKLNEKMDVFSLGCVIGELFLEGVPPFTLAQLFKYKKGEYQPPLEAIEDVNVRKLVQSMVSLDPNERWTAKEYLTKWGLNEEGDLFPKYFDTFLHGYLHDITRPMTDMDGVTPERVKQLESDYRIESIWRDFESISNHLGFSYPHGPQEPWAAMDRNLLPVCLDLPGMSHWVPKLRKLSAEDDEGALMVVAVVCTAIRNTSRSSARSQGCELLLALGERIHDEAKLDRCLPHLVYLLEDVSDNVQVAALRSLAHLLELVGAITPVNGNIFPEYIIPRLVPLLSRESVVVRCAYASCLSSLAQSAAKFLDMGQVLKTSGMLEAQDPDTENGVATEVTAFDTLKQTLGMMIEDHVITLLTDTNAAVRRSLIKSITPLCVFFGKQKTNDVILSHLITYLNDRDPFLRADFFDCIVGLAPFIGSVSLEQYIIPLMTQTLVDPVELVVERVLQAFTELADLGLIRMPKLWELLKACAKFTIHPNTWIRNATVSFFSSCAKWMSPSQVYCMLLPILRPYLECEIYDFTEPNLVSNLATPFSRAVYNRALSWASKAQKSLYWRMDKQPPVKLSASRNEMKQQLQKSSEDEQWLNRLREIGLKDGDLWKLNAFRDYVYRVARINHRLNVSEDAEGDVKGTLKIQSIGVLPKNVFFEASSHEQQPQIITAPTSTSTQPITIPVSGQNNSQPVSIPGTPQEPTRLLGILNEDGAASPRSIASGTSPAMAQPLTGAVTTTDVYGEVGQGHQDSTGQNEAQPEPQQQNRGEPANKALKTSSSYVGDDPYIWKLLENMYIESMDAEEPAQLGPKCTPYMRSTGTAANSNNSSLPKRRRGRPLGVLVSSFEEHTGAINSVVVSPDHLFFATGSDDGSVKVWDCHRLEKNVINRSVQTLQLESPVKHLTFIDNTYAIACCTQDGGVKLLRVEMYNAKTESLGPRYKKVQVMSNLQLPNEGEFAVWMEYVKTDSHAYLYVASTKCRIYAVNVKTLQIAQTFENQFTHGIPTCFVVDRRKNWLLLGTSCGILDLWDLRFGIQVKSWRFGNGPTSTPIYGLALYPKYDKAVCVSGGGDVTSVPEVTVWDVETSECHEIYRGVPGSGELETPSRYTARPVDPEDKTEPDSVIDSLSRLAALDKDKHHNRAILAMLTSAEFELGVSTGRKGYMLTGGNDRMLRFWDLYTGESSTVVSGLKTEQGKAGYNAAHHRDAKVVVEKWIPPTTKSGKPAPRMDRLPRSTAINSEQLDLGRNHAAAITDVALLLRPYEMVISVDQAGAVKVYL